jgi:hypothetical protein
VNIPLSYSEKSKKNGKNLKKVKFPSLSPFLGVKEHLVRHNPSIQFCRALNFTSNIIFVEKFIEPFLEKTSLKFYTKSCKKVAQTLGHNFFNFQLF